MQGLVLRKGRTYKIPGVSSSRLSPQSDECEVNVTLFYLCVVNLTLCYLCVKPNSYLFSTISGILIPSLTKGRSVDPWFSVFSSNRIQKVEWVITTVALRMLLLSKGVISATSVTVVLTTTNTDITPAKVAFVRPARPWSVVLKIPYLPCTAPNVIGTSLTIPVCHSIGKKVCVKNSFVVASAVTSSNQTRRSLTGVTGVNAGIAKKRSIYAITNVSSNPSAPKKTKERKNQKIN